MKEPVEALQIHRPSIGKIDLREQPIAEGEEARIKLPSINTMPHLVATDPTVPAPSSRRSSKDALAAAGGSSSRRSSNISFNNPIATLHRGSQARRLSIRGGGGAAGKASEHPAHGDNADQLTSLVPMPQNPRFSSTMSVEAQYSMLKGYEDRLWRQLCNVYPDYAGLLHRSQTPRNGQVLLRDSERHGGVPGAMDNLLSVDQLGEEEASSAYGEDVVDGPRSTRSLPPPSLHRGHGGHHGAQLPSSARHDRSWNAHVPHHRQLTLSRRLQMAQSLLDSMADNSCAITSLPSYRPSKSSNFNVIQGYNFWANCWQDEFQINEPRVTS